MLQVTPHHRLLLATKHVDFRKGIEGLAALCRNILREDPLGGTLFVFTNRRKTSVKILLYDGNGFWLCQKRFSKGTLAWWPASEAKLHSLTPVNFTFFSPKATLKPHTPRQIGAL